MNAPCSCTCGAANTTKDSSRKKTKRPKVGVSTTPVQQSSLGIPSPTPDQVTQQMGNNTTDASTESHHGVSHTLPAMNSQSMASTCQYDFPNPSTSDAPNYSPGNPIPHLSSAMSDMQSSDSDSDEDDVPFVPSFQDAISHHSHAILSGNGIQFAEPISTPILNQIKRATCKAIWRNKYVDMADLLPSTLNPQPTHYTLQVDNRSNFTINPTSKSKRIQNVEVWTTAFIRFMAVYLQRFPLEAQQLLKYMEIVRDLARRRPGFAFLYYDTQFRMLRESLALPWDRIHTEFWLMASTSIPQPQSFRAQHNTTRSNNYSKPRRFLEKTCWNYNKRSQCHNTSCNHPHLCGFCKGSHPAYQCKFPNKETAYKALSQSNTTSRPTK